MNCLKLNNPSKLQLNSAYHYRDTNADRKKYYLFKSTKYNNSISCADTDVTFGVQRLIIIYNPRKNTINFGMPLRRYDSGRKQTRVLINKRPCRYCVFVREQLIIINNQESFNQIGQTPQRYGSDRQKFLYVLINKFSFFCYFCRYRCNILHASTAHHNMQS